MGVVAVFLVIKTENVFGLREFKEAGSKNKKTGVFCFKFEHFRKVINRRGYCGKNQIGRYFSGRNDITA